MGHKTKLVVALVAVAALAAGCGSDKKDAASDGDTTTSLAAGGAGTTSDTATVGEGASAVLTKANIETAVGVPVGDGKAGPQSSNTTTCTWQSADRNTNVNVVKYERAEDLIKNVKAADPNAKPAPGVGDEAVIDYPLGQITMQIGEIGITVSVTPAPSEGALLTLAKTVTAG